MRRNGTRYSATCPILERVPGRLRRELQVADVGAEPQADAGADRHQHDVVGGQRRHAEAADKIGGAVDAAEALVDRAGVRQVVDQHHGAGAFAADVQADRRALPVDLQIAGILGVEHALAVAQPGDEGAAGLLAEDVAVRQAPVADRLLDDLRQPARHRAEEVVAGVDDFARS